MKQGYNLKSFGNNIKINCNVEVLKKKIQFLKELKIVNSIARGNGRSYGDSSINSHKTFLTKKLNKIYFFDDKKGVIKCGSGVLISEILLLDLKFPCKRLKIITPKSPINIVTIMIENSKKTTK